jgi:hypothetical protein
MMTSWKSKHVALYRINIFTCMLCYTDIFKYTDITTQRNGICQSKLCNLLAYSAIEWWLTNERWLVTKKTHYLSPEKIERERHDKVGWEWKSVNNYLVLSCSGFPTKQSQEAPTRLVKCTCNVMCSVLVRFYLESHFIL